jgi:hypothetical protein
VAARLVRTRAWERLGFARLSDYARERTGHSARSLYDLAHVHEGLADLPQIRAALVSGRLPWTRARLLARVATPEDEAAWIAYARRTSSDTLEREVRAVDRGSIRARASPPGPFTDEDGYETGERETFFVHCTPAARAKWFRARQLAPRVAGGPCPPPAVLEMVTAEVLSALPLEEDAGACSSVGASWPEPHLPEAGAGPLHGPILSSEARAEEHAAAGAGSPPIGPPAPKPDRHPRREAGAAPVPRFLQPFFTALEDADAFELDRRLRTLVVLEQRLDARIGSLLAAVAAARAYRRVGARTLEAFARERLGMSPRKARALLRLERAGQVCPELARPYRRGRLSWVQAQVLAPLLTRDEAGPWGGRWVAWAGQVTVRRLEDDVERALLLRETHPRAWLATGGLPEEARAAAPSAAFQFRERQIRAKPTRTERTSLLFVVAPREVTALARAALCTVRRRLEPRAGRPIDESEGFEAMLDHALQAWGHPHARVRAEHRVFARDGWRCVVPACSARRNLHRHHVEFRSAGGSDDPANCVTLSAFHHLRGVHAGRVGVRGRAPDGLRFGLGLRRGRAPLAVYSSGDLRLGASP